MTKSMIKNRKKSGFGRNLLGAFLAIASVISVSIGLSGCGGPDTVAPPKQAQAIDSTHECHLCGMLITEFPGPKGELYTKTSEKVKNFCSTRDLFSFLLDPEYVHQVKEVYVHDMSLSPWAKPNDSHFINARLAWFVVGSSQTGAMGETIGSFSVKKDAEAFIEQYGGKLYRFDEITQAQL
ncbi:NosL [Shewanella denitrificans OS217]|uniref:NosL n=1 Tax=Shewanella denitrificans (strain OS217 / ATCC BAA-1090 / DSM 15013) TaxID=318161 RepID=Q12M31_SHEDO|nr:nitrous oxide reductase accessory protein NosL [Shewanella denitrificans]ABE55495.1 NosL [Shewanella denitrificans OS217]